MTKETFQNGREKEQLRSKNGNIFTAYEDPLKGIVSDHIYIYIYMKL